MFHYLYIPFIILDEQTLYDEFSTTNTGFSEELYKLFGGVPGYVVECITGLSEGRSLSDYLLELRSRVERLLTTIIPGSLHSNETPKSFANSLYSSFNSTGFDVWAAIRQTGLCGLKPPRGILIPIIIDWIKANGSNPKSVILKLVKSLRSEMSNDPGLDGSLLEYEILIDLELNNNSLDCVFLCLENGEWKPEKFVKIPPKPLNGISSYSESLPINTTAFSISKYIFFYFLFS